MARKKYAVIGIDPETKLMLDYIKVKEIGTRYQQSRKIVTEYINAHYPEYKATGGVQ